MHTVWKKYKIYLLIYIIQKIIYQFFTNLKDFSTTWVRYTSSWSKFMVQKQSLILLGPRYGNKFLASPVGKKINIGVKYHQLLHANPHKG